MIQLNVTILKQTHSGGVTINDWGWHVVNHDAPFSVVLVTLVWELITVKKGFRELSHAKTVFARHRFFPTQLFLSPYGTWVLKTGFKFLLEKRRSNLK